MSDSAARSVPAEIVVHADYPRASTYDPAWVFECGMGWPVMWATEAMTQVMDLQPGMRVLDLGCGRAASSIFLAKEFGVRVWAADLWISPTENWRRIHAAGVEDLVMPIFAEAHALPFAHDYFDAIVSIGAYHYFGTDDYYLDSLIKCLKPGGQFGMLSPGLVAEFGRAVPEHLTAWYLGGFDGWHTFHSPDWWRWHWEKTLLVDIEVADMVPNGWSAWLKYNELLAQLVPEYDVSELETLQQDQGRHLGFTRMLARRTVGA